MTRWTWWSWTKSKIAPDITRKNDIRSCFLICPPPLHQSSNSVWLNEWMTGEWRQGGQIFSRWCAPPLISFLHYSEAWEVNNHCLIDVPTRKCCATVPTGHSCLLYWLISLSTQSTNCLQLGVQPGLQTSETESSGGGVKLPTHCPLV